jgi:hypothetical protein
MLNKDDLKQIGSIVHEEVQSLKTDNHAFKRNFSKIHKDMNMIINFFDRDYLELRGRVERIKKHLGIVALS